MTEEQAKEKPNLAQWGRRPPEDVAVKAHFGARAIWTDREPFFDTLPDRRGWNESSIEDRTRLNEWMMKVWKKLEVTCQSVYLGNSGESLMTQIVDGNFHFEASPQGSYGYMYLGAWEVDPS